MSVIVYSKPNCPQCTQTTRDMDILGIDYKIIDITEDGVLRNQLISEGHRSAPIVKTNTHVWSGYNQDKIKGLVSYT